MYLASSKELIFVLEKPVGKNHLLSILLKIGLISQFLTTFLTKFIVKP